MREPLRHESQTIERFLDSSLESADRAEAIAVSEAKRAGFSDEELLKIGMAVRESVVNAVVHGNRYNANKKVRFSVAKNPERFTVRVADEGEGFDYEQLPDPCAPENLLRGSGRGIFLIRCLMDEMQVRRVQPRGMEFVLVKYRVAK